MAQIKILTYNIHKGFNITGQNFLLDKIKESINLVNADVLFLQEVQGEHLHHQKSVKNWPLVSQFEYLADKTWPHFAYGKNAVYQHGHHGNAILSKFPITWFHNIDISTNLFEKRGIMHATIKCPELKKEIHLLNGHYNIFQAGQKTQIKNLCQQVKKYVPHYSPTIIAGDFNDWSIRATKLIDKELKAQEAFYQLYGEHARTFPAQFPMLHLDRIYYKNLKLNNAKILKGHPWKKLSDHLALFASFELL